MIVNSYAPTRIDLAGGTLDIFPICLIHEGSLTVNAAISLYAKTTIKTRQDNKVIIKSEDQKKQVELSLSTLDQGHDLKIIAEAIRFFQPKTGLEITTDCEAPAHSGLGGSSALLASLCTALNKVTEKNYSKKELLKIVYNLETKMIKVLTGTQDHVAALYGKINLIHYNIDGDNIMQPPLSKSFYKELRNSLILCYTEEPRFSGSNNWEIVQKSVAKDKETYDLLEKIKKSAWSMKKAIITEDIGLFGKTLGEEWENRKRLTKETSTPKIEEIISIAKNAGAISAKVCGAGGGGCMVIYTPSQKRRSVEKELLKNGIKILKFNFARRGATAKIEE